MGVAYNANHLIWMEIGRVEYCRSIGITYKEMEEIGGILLAVVEVHCRYRHPARYDDEITIRTIVEKIGSRSMQFAYQLSLAASGRPVADGYSKHVFCDRTMKPVHLPDQYRQLFLEAIEVEQQHTRVG